MAYVVGDSCVKCKFTDCVEVCPVDCFYEGENMLVINAEDCIDCGACEPECPVSAIHEEAEMPPEWQPYVEINAVFSGEKAPETVDTKGWPEHLVSAIKVANFSAWPNITEHHDPLPDAESHKEEEHKISEIKPTAS